MTTRGVHDIGGLPAGMIDRSEHPRTLYEQRVDALVMLLSHPDRGAFKVDALRRAIEEFNAKDYATLRYYDKWMRAVRVLVVELGILTDAEIDARVAEIHKQLGDGKSHAR